MCENQITAKASVTGDSKSTKTVTQSVKSPKIESVTWINIDTKEAKAKTRYEKKVGIKIVTIDSSGLYAFIIVESKAWDRSYVHIEHIGQATKKKGEKVAKEVTLFNFIPECDWAKDATKETEMTATVYIISDSRKTWTVNTLGAIVKNVTGKPPENYCGISMENKPFQEEGGLGFTTIHTDKGTVTDAITLQEKKIVIVIDPGHGWSKESTGTECRYFRYYKKNEKGERDTSGTESKSAFNLPDHVLGNMDYWIKDYVDWPSIEKKYQEWFYVIDVSLLLEKELKKNEDYLVLMTRKVEPNIETRIQLSGTDTYTARHSIPNDNDADYFISVHCDGQGSFKLTGAFVIIPRDSDTNSQKRDINESREFAQDIIDEYKALHLAVVPITQPGANDGKFVLKAGNKTQKRVIVELGRMTNPKDIKKLYETGIQEKMAKQIANAVNVNVERNKNGKK